MEFSALVLDLDGTLLDSNKQVSERNKQAVISCHQRGLTIIYATARPPRAVKELLPEELYTIGSFVYYNGALVRSSHCGEEHHFPIERDLFGEFLDHCLDIAPSVEFSIEVMDEWYCLGEIEVAVVARRKGNPIQREIDELKQYHPTKILLSSIDESNAAALVDPFATRLNIVITDGGKLIQIMSLTASKEAGVQLLCDSFGISMSELIVFGDDYNDTGLLGAAGYSVAMGNAPHDVKEAADEVALTNDEDGVGVVLERILAE
ncbi:Cof subfamily protein (haloacid dehalogenase superfamily)/HAD superfamily hydrolase (TIGR01484 family) [Paenibacillus taihuensis]|uniref:Cof subfamily protein (Haloacid dehalogenase superfamily)/HAD superfamily hydrolase (TIGR01484 family) n=1 Tax=Paenibacillus taihuensis TaxID=1156355 RepID=A0A3D9SF62_9BACL|nr:HAD family hydrolase [Paenibacillus taihuensis]REE94542.1 Cof subfamily protein (haloacid dehalogenase superfamily)/HAD superfamily hydrolase (TIGR01484 family) [Paenibacillus taihuensis]